MVSSCPQNLHYMTSTFCSLLAPFLWTHIAGLNKPLNHILLGGAGMMHHTALTGASVGSHQHSWWQENLSNKLLGFAVLLVCVLAPMQTMHMVKFDIPAIEKWAKLLHWFRCPTNILKLRPFPSKTKPGSQPPAHSLEQAQKGQNEGATWSILPVRCTWPRQATPQLFTILAPPVCSSTAEPALSYHHLTSVVGCLYSESKGSTNANQWVKALKNVSVPEALSEDDCCFPFLPSHCYKLIPTSLYRPSFS